MGGPDWSYLFRRYKDFADIKQTILRTTSLKLLFQQLLKQILILIWCDAGKLEFRQMCILKIFQYNKKYIVCSKLLPFYQNTKSENTLSMCRLQAASC